MTCVSLGQPGSKYAGHRYIKNGDEAMMLLFDKSGYIAGVQAGVSNFSSYKPIHVNQPRLARSTIRHMPNSQDTWLL